MVSLLAWVLTIAAAYLVIISIVEYPDARLKNLRQIGPAVLIAWAGRRAARRIALRSRAEAAPRSERWFSYCSWVIAILFFLIGCGGIREGSCPHGWIFGIGPIGIAKSDCGGPCKNWVPGLASRHLHSEWYVWFDSRFGS
jgi:hypothetical protein